MFIPRPYTIRSATPADGEALRRLAVLDSRSPIQGPALVAEMDGAIVAAIAMDSGRTIADPFVYTAGLSVALRGTRTNYLRRGAMPSLRERIVASLRPVTAAAAARN
jgi:hypothetical protein